MESNSINSNHFKIINFMLYIGEKISVNWNAGKWSHTGQFPIQWLNENKYLEKTKRELPTTVSYSFSSIIIVLYDVREPFLRFLSWI